MSEQEQNKTGKVPLKSFLEDFRSTLTDAELREKYRLSARAFISLIKALLAKNLINADDLAGRKKMAVQRDLEKQSEFLSGLYICPNCSHPHPSPFERCPACGAEPGGSYADQELLDPVMSSTGSHFLVDDLDDPEEHDDQDAVLAASEDDQQQPGESAEPSNRKDKTKSSPLKSVRSLISKLKKK
jgi:hypothetical protein